MYSVKFDNKKAMKVLNNVVKYSNGFIRETNAQEKTVASRLASTSIEAFYDYLDGLARTNPGILHHVYEWGEVGNPFGRLYELKKILSGTSSVEILGNFLQSSNIPEGASTPFYEKATIMEEGTPVVVQEVEAQALFFEIDGQEFFRTGPIVIENPGGAGVRGSFLKAFEEFYDRYFEDIYLRAIRYYDHFKNPRQYANNFRNAAMSGNADRIGRTTALSWVLSAPGENYG